MGQRMTIRRAMGGIVGYIEEMSNGDKKVTDYMGRILGYYKKSNDSTTDYMGRILYYGDMSAALLVNS